MKVLRRSGYISGDGPQREIAPKKVQRQKDDSFRRGVAAGDIYF